MSDLEITDHDDGHVLKSEKDPTLQLHPKASLDKGVIEVTKPISPVSSDYNDDRNGQDPTEEEKQTLRKVAGPISYAGYMLCFVEAANNASYYGVTGILANFIQRPLPPGGNGWVSQDPLHLFTITQY